MQIDDLYERGDWAGHTNYECKVCPYASLDEGAARRHAATHLSTPPRSGLVDHTGRPIEGEPVVGPSSEFTRGAPADTLAEPVGELGPETFTEPHHFTIDDPILEED